MVTKTTFLLSSFWKKVAFYCSHFRGETRHVYYKLMCNASEVFNLLGLYHLLGPLNLWVIVSPWTNKIWKSLCVGCCSGIGIPSRHFYSVTFARQLNFEPSIGFAFFAITRIRLGPALSCAYVCFVISPRSPA